MTQEDIETVRRALEFFNRRERDAWIAECEPDMENIPPREWPESTPLQGAEAIWDFFVEAQQAWDEGSFEWGELIDAGGDKVVANQRRQMLGKTSGAAVDWNYWVVLTFRNARILRFEWFADRVEALQAAGLRK